MDLGTAQSNQGATIEGGKALRKEKTVKIRMDALEIRELDDIGSQLGFATRATTLRTLMKMFRELQQARKIVQAHEELQQAEVRFKAVMAAEVKS